MDWSGFFETQEFGSGNPPPGNRRRLHLVRVHLQNFFDLDFFFVPVIGANTACSLCGATGTSTLYAPSLVSTLSTSAASAMSRGPRASMSRSTSSDGRSI